MRDITITLYIEGQPVRARYYPVFVFEQGVNCELSPLFILANGKFLLGKQLLDIEGLRDLLEREYVMTVLPEGQDVYVPEVTSFQATNVVNAVSEEEFLRETADIIRELNGQPTTLDRCRDAWNAYLNDKSPENLETLKAAYESVPEHNRTWLGDFDTKDFPIRQAIYGEQSD